MKKYALVVALLLAVSCGDSKTTTTTDPSTDAGTVTPTSGSISVSNLSPVEAIGELEITSIVDGENPYGEGRMVTTKGEYHSPLDGDPNPFLYEIKTIYTTYFVDGIEYGEIKSVSHTWGKDLVLPMGISTCIPGALDPDDGSDAGCAETSIYPETHLLIFGDQILHASPGGSTISGTVIY